MRLTLPLAILCSLSMGLLSLFASPASAADPEDDARLWMTTIVSTPLFEQVSANLFFQTRLSNDFGDLERVLLNPSLSRPLGGGVSAAIGYDAHLLETPRDETEHRAWQQLAFNHSPFGLGVLHRARLEERFLERTDGAALRLRYFLRASAAIPSTPWSLFAGNELFFDLNSKRRGPDSGFGETRAMAGLDYQFSPAIQLEAGYMLQYIDRKGRDAANHALMLQLSFSQ